MELKEILKAVESNKISVENAEKEIIQMAHTLLAKKIGMKEVGKNLWVKKHPLTGCSTYKYILTVHGFQRVENKNFRWWSTD